jgi:predicted Zn-dependent protease
VQDTTTKPAKPAPDSTEPSEFSETSRDRATGPSPDAAGSAAGSTVPRPIPGGSARPNVNPLPTPDAGQPPEPTAWKAPLSLPREEEAKLGAAVHDLIVKHHLVSTEVGFRNRLLTLVAPLLESRAQGSPEPSLDIIQSDEPFAFSHVGGYLYVSQFLDRLVPHDVELQFLLAHEIAHIDKRHGIQKLAREMAGEIPGPGSPGLARRVYHQIAVGYDAEQEYEADAWACQQLIKLGHSRHEILGLHRRMMNYEATHQNAGRQKPTAPLDEEVQDVERHWRRHPAIPLRLSKLDRISGMTQSQAGR